MNFLKLKNWKVQNLQILRSRQSAKGYLALMSLDLVLFVKNLKVFSKTFGSQSESNMPLTDRSVPLPKVDCYNHTGRIKRDSPWQVYFIDYVTMICTSQPHQILHRNPTWAFELCWRYFTGCALYTLPMRIHLLDEPVTALVTSGSNKVLAACGKTFFTLSVEDKHILVDTTAAAAILNKLSMIIILFSITNNTPR